MKTKTTIFRSALVAVLLVIATTQSYATFSYTISFTASGATTAVGSVQVQNLTKGTTATVASGNTLTLTDQTTAIDALNSNDGGIRIFQNGSTETSTLTFYARQAGIAQVAAYTIDGRKVVGLTTRLEAGNNSLELVLPTGMYVIRVSGTGYSYSTKLQSQTSASTPAGIEFLSNTKVETSTLQKIKATDPATIFMTYTTGDQLLYKATSGIYSTIVTDVPIASKTTNFDFVACTDADGNNYTTVTIGTQTWMAENLKTTKYNDVTAIPYVTDNMTWYKLLTPAYCWYNNNADTYKNKYGALYNWFAVNTAKLAPAGWHVPTDTEWTTLTNYVSANLGMSLNVAKALSANTDWITSSTTGTIGCNLTLNNSTGFSALPNNSRGYQGMFNSFGSNGNWWSSTWSFDTSACGRGLQYDSSDVEAAINFSGLNGFSVRCVRDSQ